MKSCHTCRNQHICSIYKSFDQTNTEGLKMQILTTHETPTEKTTSSWMDIFRAIARACNYYQVWESRAELTTHTKKYAQDLAKNLKKDKSFTKQFINATSPESRIKLITRRLDDSYDEIIDFLSRSQKDLEDAEEIYESFTHEVLSYFGY